LPATVPRVPRVPKRFSELDGMSPFRECVLHRAAMSREQEFSVHRFFLDRAEALRAPLRLAGTATGRVSARSLDRGRLAVSRTDTRSRTQREFRFVSLRRARRALK